MRSIERFVDSDALAESRSVLARGERNDCVVRAFMVVLDISYESAHRWVADKFKRRFRQGTYTAKYLSNVLGTVKNGKRIKLMGISPKYRLLSVSGARPLVNIKNGREMGYTVKSFADSHRVGRYFIVVSGHALALVDGVLYGNGGEGCLGLKRRVNWVLEIS